MPDSVIYSPSDLGSFHMLYIDQGVAQLQYLWKHFHTAGLPNKLAVIALKWAQLLARVQQPTIFFGVLHPRNVHNLMGWVQEYGKNPTKK